MLENIMKKKVKDERAEEKTIISKRLEKNKSEGN